MTSLCILLYNLLGDCHYFCLLRERGVIIFQGISVTKYFRIFELKVL